MNYFESKNNSLIARKNGEMIKISPWGKNSFRLCSVFMGDIREGEIALLEPEKSDVIITLDETQASITNGKITAFIKSVADTFQIEYRNKNGEVLLREIDPNTALKKLPRHFKSISGDNFRVKQSFEADADEKIYGMGQYQQEILNLKGCNLELAHRNSQASIPFYISNKGYGFLWHNTAIGEVHFGINTTEWLADTTKQLDYWITAGDTPAEILGAYTDVTGKPPMMPEYGLGYWQSKLRYYTQDEVLKIAREHKERNIPLDVLIIDYYHWPRCKDESLFGGDVLVAPVCYEHATKRKVYLPKGAKWTNARDGKIYEGGTIVDANAPIDTIPVFLRDSRQAYLIGNI